MNKIMTNIKKNSNYSHGRIIMTKIMLINNCINYKRNKKMTTMMTRHKTTPEKKELPLNLLKQG